ncbi:GNAT family N-acetyltransferase [Acidimangrovimonas sediminis]|uniref:GNAT family N-acetyltransferase n=1 Tax=Acidimangrovimonas sediminis TaxID=2056283 RepID=UPI000C80DCC4|nr:GNAT family N-acetyltransferase [Acidimangrovimonas sediminis]
MTPPDTAQLYAVNDATWPPAAFHHAGPWTLREGQGGGQRVSAATATDPVTEADIETAETAAQALGQTPIFMIRPGDEDLDSWLDARGYRVKDPVALYLAPVATVAGEVPPVTAFALWPPLQVQLDIWEEGGIGPARLAVMERAAGPKTAILGRRADKPAGTAYVAIHAGVAMVHALEVPARMRRQKAALYMMRRAALWAGAEGAEWLSLAVTEANAGARALYEGLGMQIAGRYHYRVR